MSTTFGLLGIAFALAFMTFAVYKNWSILYSSIIAVIVIVLTNKLDLLTTLTSTYIDGFAGFAAPNFILFLEGAMLGKLYENRFFCRQEIRQALCTGCLLPGRLYS